jgi:hypothetical protein
MRAEAVLEKAAWIRAMLGGLSRLPLTDLDALPPDHHNQGVTEPGPRRALAGELDLGRNTLPKGLGEGAFEYKQVAEGLPAHGALTPATGQVLTLTAGVCNRLVHCSQESTHRELFKVCSGRRGRRKRFRLKPAVPGTSQ